jgi:5-methylcytosine-specific restriction endonuclease McrA
LPPTALRRAVRDRDGGRCQYPGCQFRRTDAHHIQYWSNGSETRYRNLCSLCKRHHKLVHDTGIISTTIIPPHSGERLDLHLAIWICLNNARNQAKRRQDPQAQAQCA